MNCIVIDDEPLARAEMKVLIREVSDISILGSFSNAPAALAYLQDNRVDLVFLDIEMPMVTGLEFATELKGNAMVIFTTAYPQYALKSYELDAIDYLLKPIDISRLDRAVRKAESYLKLLSNRPEDNTLEGNTNDFLLIKSDRKFYRIKYSAIKFIEGLKDYIVIYTADKKLITAMNLKTFHQKIPQDIFFRISKSYIVNTNYIDSFDNHIVYVGENELPLGEVYRKDFFTAYSKEVISPDS